MMTKLRAFLRRASSLARAFAGACVVALAAVGCSSGSAGTERSTSCSERSAKPTHARGGEHLERAYFGPHEVPRDRNLQQVVRDGAVLIRYRPDIAAEDRRALRNFVTNLDRRWAVAAPDPDQSEAITAVHALRTLTCEGFNLARLRSFRDKWISQVEKNGGSIAGLAAAATGGRGKALGKRGRTISIAARDLPAGNWPLRVRRGQLRCQGAGAVIFRIPGGKEYGITRAAVDRGLPPLNSLWKDKPDQPGTSMDITPLVDRGLALCDPPLGTLATSKRFARQQLKRASERARRRSP